MTAFTQFDRAVSSMMSKYGGAAILHIVEGSTYDPSTSENIETITDYNVNAMFFDYVRKTEGLGSDGNTLVKSGDKQVYIQPLQKSNPSFNPIPLPDPTKDKLTIGNVQYKIVTAKQLNPSNTDDGCVLYELYVRQ